MSKHWTTALATAVLALGLSCHSNDQDEVKPTAPAADKPQAPIEAAPDETALPAPLAGTITGKVVETMDSGGYTYVLVDTGSEKVWAAVPQVAVGLGAEVTFDGSMPMLDNHSSTLDRTFDRVYFAGSLGLDAPAPSGHPGATVTEGSDVAGIEKADGGVTVEEVFTRRAELVGTEVVLRAKVVKFSPEIMGKNWLHVQDGTGGTGTNDLTITTAATFAVGDTVLVRGVLLADRDFGYGYEYDLIIEDARVTKE